MLAGTGILREMRFAPIALVVFIVAAGLAAATAQRAVAADPTLTAELIDFKPWLGPNNDLQATFNVTNHGSTALPALQVKVEGFAGPDSRSNLSDQLAGSGLIVRWSDTTLSQDPTLAPGETRQLVFDHKAPLSTISFFQSLHPDQADRAYPVRFTVSAGGFTAAEIDTQLLYFQEAQGVDHPLGLALVIPLDTPTVFDAQGRETSRALEDSIGAGGRLNRILGALGDPRHADVTVTVAPTGKLLDSLLAMSSPSGFTRLTPSGPETVSPDDPVAQAAAATIQRLKSLAARPGVRLIASPYSGAPLPGLMANGLSSDVQTQVEAGRNELKSVLGFDPLPGWFLPSMGLLDETTLGQVTGLGVQDLILSASSLQTTAPPLLTPAAQVRVQTAAAGASRSKSEAPGTPAAGALVEDDVLASRLQDVAGLGPIQIRQRFFAESATILLEQPAHSRTVAVVTPPDWNPDQIVIDGILDAITPATGSPWMTGAAPDSALAQVSETTVRLVAQNIADSLPQAPARDYLDQLRAARSSLDDFVGLGPPSPMIFDLTRRLLVAEGGDWWGRPSSPDRGKALARSVVDAVKAEFAKIKAPRDQTIVLTTHQATIPLALTSGLNYKVWVRVGLETDKLAFDRGEPCHSPLLPAQTTCLRLELQPGAQTVPVRAVANFTGSFHVNVDLLTDRSPPAQISTGKLSIRSTAYNIVALGLMAAAALFILLSWARTVARRKVAATEVPIPQNP